ncbi:CpaF family protein [Eubacterium ruminantium]|uniref:CpaF family protein n=1 Tax=Eubacterium ruminantium TaxID=42322 RepID=UPI00156A7139|nr:CpaF family protein [Eubacterium ruminantium]
MRSSKDIKKDGKTEDTLSEKLRKEVIDEIDFNRDIDDEEVKRIIDRCILRQADDEYISLRRKLELKSEIYNAIRKLDILSDLLEDDSISEVMINGPDRIFVEKNGKIIQSDLHFENPEKLMQIIQTIAAAANRPVNDMNPIVDVILEDGSRVNIVLSGVSLDGTAVTIRKFPKERMDMNKLVALGSLDRKTASFLKMMVKAGYNIFISGGTGSGKTTFLNALADFISPDERVITIEDTAELRIKGIENLVRLEVRNANVAGNNSITIRDLIRASLRMRPDRIIVGEVRDEAAIDMLTAMNTGHDGSISTGHANSVRDMMLRLETMVLMGADLPVRAIRQQIAAAIDIVIHLGRLRDNSRRVLEISEVVGMENEEIKLRQLYKFEEVGSFRDIEEVGEKKAVYGGTKSNEQDNKVNGRLRKINDLMNLTKLEFAGLIDIYKEEDF